jgi:hypothetical protein
MKRVLVLASVISLGFIGSCSKDKEEDPVTDPCAYDASQLKYTGFIKEIIDRNCASDGACHGTPQQPNAGGPYSNYAEVKAKVDAGTFTQQVFVTKDMPQGGSLSTCDYKKLEDWVHAGAPE